jgi:precorrin-4/cobalt-precorrin-4 C11-methyltransferase
VIYFVGAGSGDPELITVKGKRLLESADTVLYTGSLVPKEVLGWCKEGALIVSSEDMDYEEIFAFLS